MSIPPHIASKLPDEIISTPGSVCDWHEIDRNDRTEYSGQANKCAWCEDMEGYVPTPSTNPEQQARRQLQTCSMCTITPC
eukprot:6902750-Pyramimonas_sp.AAC.1